MPLRPRCHALQFLRLGYRLFGVFKPLGDLNDSLGGSRPAFFPTLDLSPGLRRAIVGRAQVCQTFLDSFRVGVRVPYGGAGVAQFGPSAASRCLVEFA